MNILPTGRAAALAAVMAVIVAVLPSQGWPPIPTAAVVLVVLIVLVGLDALVSVSPKKLIFARRHATVAVVGQETRIHWEVRSESRRRVKLYIADSLAPSLNAVTRRATFTVPAESRVKQSTTITPSRRGRFELTEMTVRIVGPLGLGARQRVIPMHTRLRVHPPFRSRKDAELKIRQARLLQMGIRTTRGFGGGTDFEQLREYGRDDEFRRIDWAATARRGRPIVRTYRAERNQSVVIMLDNGRTMAGQVAGVPRVEHGMDAAMMLAAVASGVGDRCGMITFDRKVHTVLPPSGRGDQVMRITEAMFDLQPELAESDYQGAFRTALARFRRRAMLVILTDLVDQAVEYSLIPALPLITRTHFVVVGSVLDPQIVAWANGERLDDDRFDDTAAAYRQAAAATVLAERRRTAAKLRGLGVTVVDSPPGSLSVDLADTYLLAKGSSRI